jgi:tRNA threonylcarbamoyladenosine biosynthesis protein TsaB
MKDGTRPAPLILAIDTSTEIASLALYRPVEGILAEQTWLSGREQTTQVLPTLERLMALVGVTTADIGGIAVATGPGSFSGVRIGLSNAKSMAYALQIPVWGVPTLDALAYQQVAVTAARVCAVLKMGRGRLAWALYQTKGTRWQRLSAYGSGTAQEMAQSIASEEATTGVLFCGEIDSETATAITELLGDRASIAPAAAGARRAGYLAELALQRGSRGESDDPKTLHAVYLQTA